MMDSTVEIEGLVDEDASLVSVLIVGSTEISAMMDVAPQDRRQMAARLRTIAESIDISLEAEKAGLH